MLSRFAKLASLTTVSATVKAENGISRVLSMLADMKSKSESEGQAEKVAYKEFESWCSTTSTQLGANIEKLGEEISEGKNTINAQTAKAKGNDDKSAKNVGEISKLVNARADKKSARKADNKEFLIIKSDYETSIASIEKAIGVLKNQPKVVSQQSALLEIEQSSLSKAQKELVTLLVTGSPAAHAYEHHSSGVIGMLDDLKAQFIAELNAEIEQETKKAGETNKLVMTLSGQVENLEEEKKRFDGSAGKHRKMAAGAQSELEDDESALAADKKTLLTTTSTCTTKSDDFAARTELREGELTALNHATEVIQGIADKKTASGFVQTMSFMQISSNTESDKRKMQKVKQLLKSAGQQQASKKLQLIALKVSEGGAFDKVMGMIEQMMDRLKAEALEESGKHGQCMVWMSENKSDLDTSAGKMADLRATIDEQTGTAGTTAEKIKDLAITSNEAGTALAEAGKVRAIESKENAATVADAKEGEDAVDQALQILNEFYAKATEAMALVQTGAEDSVGQPSTWDSSFQGNQGGGSDVINLLEVIQADFLKLRTDTESAEAASAKAYKTFLEEEQIATAARQSELAHTKSAHANAERSLSAAQGDLGNEENVHSGFVEQKRVIEQDKGCVALSNKTPDELFKERMDARDNEIQSLNEALSVLK